MRNWLECFQCCHAAWKDLDVNKFLLLPHSWDAKRPKYAIHFLYYSTHAARPISTKWEALSQKRIHEEKNRFAWLSNKIKIRFILTAKLFKMKLAVKCYCLKIIYSVTKKDTFSRQERKSQDPWTWTLNEWLLWLQVSKVLWPFPKSHNTSRYYPFNRERLNSAALGLCCFPGKTKFAPGDCPGVLVIEWAGYATQLGVKCHRNSTQFWLVLRSLWSAVDGANWWYY